MTDRQIDSKQLDNQLLFYCHDNTSQPTQFVKERVYWGLQIQRVRDHDLPQGKNGSTQTAMVLKQYLRALILILRQEVESALGMAGDL